MERGLVGSWVSLSTYTAHICTAIVVIPYNLGDVCVCVRGCVFTNARLFCMGHGGTPDPILYAIRILGSTFDAFENKYEPLRWPGALDT